MKLVKKSLILWLTVAVMGLAALLVPWFAQFRVSSQGSEKNQEIIVRSQADSGPGSLREAIFAAARATDRVRIRIDAEKITLDSPLPPLINAKGIEIYGPVARCELNARALKQLTVIDVSSPNVTLRRLKILQAAGTGILVRERGALLQELFLLSCGEGIHVVDGVRDIRVEDSQFEGNKTGIYLSPGVSLATFQDNLFTRHSKAAFWAVSPRPQGQGAGKGLMIRNSRFTEDQLGVLLIHVPATVENNIFEGMKESALHLSGNGITVQENHIFNGSRNGVYAEEAEGILIRNNEIDHVAGSGILLQRARNATVQGNRLYNNGYGITVLFDSVKGPSSISGNLLLQHRQDGLYIVGSSPILKDNTVKSSNGIGLHLLEFVAGDGLRTPAKPLLEGNILGENLKGDLIRDEYRVSQ